MLEYNKWFEVVVDLEDSKIYYFEDYLSISLVDVLDNFFRRLKLVKIVILLFILMKIIDKVLVVS